MTTVAFQGQPGAYSDLASRTVFPNATTLPCESFQAAMDAVHDGRADYAVLPPENSLVGRVADMHALLPKSGLLIVGETFLRVEHCLLARKGSKIADIKRVHSHPVALGQIRKLISTLNASPVVEYDTAGAAEIVARLNNKEDAAIASSLAGEMYGLEVLRRNVEDESHNTTRFYVMAKTAPTLAPDLPGLMTTFVFNVRNVPAALYKALGGFATNGVNMTRLESYMLNGSFTATQFLVEAEGHPAHNALARAFEELQFFCTDLKVLGTYKMDPYRQKLTSDGVNQCQMPL